MEQIGGIEGLTRCGGAESEGPAIEQAQRAFDDEWRGYGVDVSSVCGGAACGSAAVRHDVDDELLVRPPMVVNRYRRRGACIVQVVERSGVEDRPQVGDLERTDASIEQVAAGSGLGTAATLRRHFSRAVNTTPTAYRASFRGR